MREAFKGVPLSVTLFAGCAIAGLTATTPAWAQAVAEDGARGNEIIVTAQKREERLLDVPVSVSAVSSQALTQQNLVSIRDFYTRIPGIQLSGNNTQDISVRGINAGGATNPTVSILIDDIQVGSSTYLGRPPIPDLDPATIERVEVLRGPQGTLYGASSLGGLIKYVTKAPSLTDFSGRVEAGVNTVKDGGEGWSLRGSVNAPLVSDRIGVMLSAFYRDDPRYIDSIVSPSGATAKDANKNIVWGGRAALLFKPTDTLSVTLAALYQKQDSAGANPIPVCSTCSTTSPSGTTISYDPRGVPDVRTARAAVTAIQNELYLYSAKIALDLDDMQLVSLTAWGRNRQDNVIDATSRFGFLDAIGIYPAGGTYIFSQPLLTNKFTQELRLSGTATAFDWLVGAFYTNERSSLAQAIQREGAAPQLTVYSGTNDSTYEEKAVFGDVTVHLTDKFDVQVGGRYAANQQDYLVASVIDAAAQPIFGPGENHLFRSKENAFTWLFSPSYKFTPDLMAYARIAKGYRPGGPNTETPGAAPTFAADTVINYELGLKGTVLDRMLTFDMAAFVIDWKNIQLQNTSIPSQFVFFENGEKARSRGLEAQATLTPLPGLTITANTAITDAELTKTLDPTIISDDPTIPYVQRLLGRKGDRLPYSARFTGNFGVQQDFAISASGTGYVGFNVNYIGNRYGLLNQNSTTARFERAKLPGYTLVDLRAGLGLSNGIDVNFYVRNLFDKKGITSVDSRNGTQVPQITLVTPRTIGMTASLRF
ncbi:TonB-dependent receptor [Sphingobium sp. HBC34]|uniref:TonB-dependent receptor n=1 Tax=Sphingobium cyanobacteriorum TaxID=3063954 RepID=A0ABT8ZPA4_9SPHN|nr:TonB-dependent receptor [Sphingobium sp. HBC34]MDO7835585.1 TonB-dependent receptor [Sphingobium sp. HBC34]